MAGSAPILETDANLRQLILSNGSCDIAESKMIFEEFSAMFNEGPNNNHHRFKYFLNIIAIIRKRLYRLRLALVSPELDELQLLSTYMNVSTAIWSVFRNFKAVMCNEAEERHRERSADSGAPAGVSTAASNRELELLQNTEIKFNEAMEYLRTHVINSNGNLITRCVLEKLLGLHDDLFEYMLERYMVSVIERRT